MEKRITKWLERGLITKETALSLLEDVKIEKAKIHKIRMNITIYTIAAVLIGIGIITFISANNWILELFKNMAPIIKILLAFSLTALCFWSGYKLAYENQTFPKLGGALIVLSSLMIGATYALTGQIYNINANSSTLIFTWLISILPVAYIYRIFPVNVISIILFITGIIYYYVNLGIDSGLTWSIFIPLIIGVGLYSAGNIPVVLKDYNNFSISYKTTGLVPIFLTLISLVCYVHKTYQLLSEYYIIPVIFLLILNFINYVKSSNQKDKLMITETIIMSSILVFLLAALLIDIPVFVVSLLANAAIITIIYYCFEYGYKFENKRVIIITNWFLILYILVNYSRWGWSLMNKSLFFILGGVILLTVGMFLEKKRKGIEGKNEQ